MIDGGEKGPRGEVVENPNIEGEKGKRTNFLQGIPGGALVA